MPDEIDPKTGQPKSEGRRRLEALESEIKTLREETATLKKALADRKKPEEKPKDEDPDEWFK